MRFLLVAGGVVVATVYGSDIEELTDTNPAITSVVDTFGVEQVIGMNYANGVLSGSPTPEPAPQPAVPQVVSMRQACLQLEIDGLLDDVEAIVAGLPKLYQIEWQRASVVQRNNLLVETVRLQKGMTPAQIDALFVAAEKL